MADLGKARELYQLYIDRYTETGCTPNQAAYYKACQEINNTSATIEEASQRIQGSSLMTDGGVAVVLDKMEAMAKAGRETGMDSVAETAEKEMAILREQPQLAYSKVSHWLNIQNEKGKYLKTMEAFCALFLAYQAHFVGYEADIVQTAHPSTMNKMKDNLNNLLMPTSDFTQLANMPAFRSLIRCSDAMYQDFVHTIQTFQQSGLQPRDLTGDGFARADAEFNRLVESRVQMQPVCQKILATPKEPPYVQVSPDTSDGDYQYISAGGDR